MGRPSSCGHWGLNAAGNGFDASRGEIEMRKFNIAEVKVLRKYVPGLKMPIFPGWRLTWPCARTGIPRGNTS